jgi:prephenate dehydrogenase
LLVLGCGLLGSSVALAARAVGVVERVVGLDAHPASVAAARSLGVFDEVYQVGRNDLAGVPDAVLAASFAVVASPPSALAAGVKLLAPSCATIMDVGSVKGSVIADLERLGGVPSQFVPCHPMAGSERTGAEAAQVDLFTNRWVMLTPTAGTDAAATDRAAAFWCALGARVERLGVAEHDAAVAYTSHLPYLLACAFMGTATATPAAVGPGFVDFSRIAKANPSLWREILHSNAQQLRPLLKTLAVELQRLDGLLDEDRLDELEAYLQQRRDERLLLDDSA